MTLPAAPLPAALWPTMEVPDALGELELAGLLADEPGEADEPGDREPKLGRVALVPRTTFTGDYGQNRVFSGTTPRIAS
jgi:hypothetical protein